MAELIQLVVRGVVVDRVTGRGLAGSLVELRVDATSGSELIASELVDDTGAFAIELEDEAVRTLLQPEHPGLFFRVTKATLELLNTQNTLRWIPARAGVPATLTVGSTTAPPSPTTAPTPVIEGTVTYSDGSPVVGNVVRVASHLVDTRVDLGAVRTTEEGRYSILYARPTPTGSSKAAPAIEVLVENGDATAFVLGSGLILNPPDRLKVNLQLKASPPTTTFGHARIIDRLNEALGDINLSAVDTAQGVNQLAAATGLSPREVKVAATAQRLAERSVTLSQPIAAPSLYALLSQTGVQSFVALGREPSTRIQSALASAVKAGLISSSEGGASAVTALLPKLKALAVHDALTNADSSPSALSANLSSAGLSSTQRETLVAAWLDHQDSGAEFWAAVAAHSEFSGEEAKVNAARFRLLLLALSGNRQVVVSKIADEVGAEAASSGVELSKKPLAWWTSRLSTTSPESWLPSNNGVQISLDAFATGMREALLALHPTQAFVAGLASAPPEIVGFVDEFEDFQIDRDEVEQYLERKLASVPEETRDRVRSLQTLFRLTTSSDVAETLIADGVPRLSDLASLPREVLQAELASGMPLEADPNFIRRAASGEVAMAAGLMSIAAPQLNQLPLGVTSPARSGPVAASLDRLFGDEEFCSCAHCQSVFGPAAYLVSLGTLVRRAIQNPAGTTDGYQIVTAESRRPDLKHVVLSCANTDTPLPYIDLVNELLESRIRPARCRQVGTDLHVGATEDPSLANPITDPPPIPTFPTDTTRSADELAAHPEFVWYPAHRQLARSAPDWRLPFDRPTVEMRGYLGLLGTSLIQLRDAMNRGDSARTRDAAYERLGLTVADVNVALRSGDAETLQTHAWDLWGLSATPTDPRELGPSVDAPWRPESLGNWETIRVRALLDRLGLRLDELAFIIGTGYLRRFATLSLPALGAGCSLEGVVLTISWPSPLEAGQPGGTPASPWKARLYAAALEGLFRFVWLWRRLKGWSPGEVDQALLLLLGATGRDLTPDHLTSLATIETLRQELGIKVIELLTFWGPLSAVPEEVGGRSLFARLFLTPSTRNQVDPLLTSIPEEVPAAGVYPTMGERQVEQIWGALGLTEAEATSIHDPLRRSLADLAILVRHVLLARSLKLSVTDLTDLLSLVPSNPFGAGASLLGGAPAQTLTFVRSARRLLASRVELGLLRHLLRGDGVGAAGAFAPTDDAIVSSLSAAQRSLRTLGELIGSTPRSAPQLAELDAELESALRLFLLGTEATRLLTVLNAERPLNASENAAELPFVREALRRVFPARETSLVLALACANATDVEQRKRTILSAINETRALPTSSPLAPLTGNETTSLTWAEVEAAAGWLLQEHADILRRYFFPTAGDPAPTAVEATIALERIAITEEYVAHVVAMPSGTTGEVEARQRAVYFAAHGLDRLVRQRAGTDPVVAKGILEALPALEEASNVGLREVVTRLLQLLRGELPSTTVDTATLTLLGLSYTVSDDILALEDASPWTVQTTWSRILASAAARVREARTPELVARAVLESLGETDDRYLDLLLSSARGVLLPGSPTALALSCLLRQEFEVLPTFAPFAGVQLVELRAAIERIEKTVRLARQLGLTAIDLAPYASQANDATGWVSLRALPVTGHLSPGAFQNDRLNAYLRTLDAATLRAEVARRRGSSTPAVSPLSLLESSAQRLPTLAKLLGLDADEAKALIEDSWGVLDSSSVPTFVSAFSQASQTLRLLARLQIQVEQALRWTTPSSVGGDDSGEQFTLRLGQVQEIRRFGITRTGTEGWAKLSRSAVDRVREASRDALATYLVRQLELRSRDDLYARLLIDTEMSCCMNTTRVLQAIAALQLFVQRCTLGLEDAKLDAAWAERWDWMRRYRVWEANRKIFLYPENWIEPELRQTKTPLFKEFEERLQQEKLTEDSIEGAVRGYLGGLDRIARLDVCATAYEPESNDQPSVLHVLARTDGEPATYYYRRRIGTTEWTHWEKADLDIQGDHVLLAVVHRKLHAFWLESQETREQAKTASPVSARIPGLSALVASNSDNLFLQAGVSVRTASAGASLVVFNLETNGAAATQAALIRSLREASRDLNTIAIELEEIRQQFGADDSLRRLRVVRDGLVAIRARAVADDSLLKAAVRAVSDLLTSVGDDGGERVPPRIHSLRLVWARLEGNHWSPRRRTATPLDVKMAYGLEQLVLIAEKWGDQIGEAATSEDNLSVALYVPESDSSARLDNNLGGRRPDGRLYYVGRFLFTPCTGEFELLPKLEVGSPELFPSLDYPNYIASHRPSAADPDDLGSSREAAGQRVGGAVQHGTPSTLQVRFPGRQLVRLLDRPSGVVTTRNWMLTTLRDRHEPTLGDAPVFYRDARRSFVLELDRSPVIKHEESETAKPFLVVPFLPTFYGRSPRSSQPDVALAPLQKPGNDAKNTVVRDALTPGEIVLTISGEGTSTGVVFDGSAGTDGIRTTGY